MQITKNYEELRRITKNFLNYEKCANMPDEELDAVLSKFGIVKNKNKVYSVRRNARIVLKIQKEFGTFDRYLWAFVDNRQVIGNWKTVKDIPTMSKVSIAISEDMKRRGIRFMGPTITYSFMQSIGLVNDHLCDCEYK